ncbi:MAG: hypothetical protein ABIF85_03685 [Nanoarchaeota archaeon]|nr:hypothetical protein [Nanoarchaeota archaeon]
MDNNGLGKTLKDVDVGVRKHWDDTSDADVANEYADQLYNEVLRNEVENGKISFERGAEIIDALLESATMGAFLNNLPLKTEDLLAHKLNDKLGEIYTRKDVNPMYIHGSTINGLAIRLTYGLGMHEILKASKGQ